MALNRNRAKENEKNRARVQILWQANANRHHTYILHDASLVGLEYDFR